MSLGEQWYTKAEFTKIFVSKIITYIPNNDAGSGKKVI